MSLPFLGFADGKCYEGLNENRNQLGEDELVSILSKESIIFLRHLFLFTFLHFLFNFQNISPHPVGDFEWEKTLQDQDHVADQRTEQLEGVDGSGKSASVGQQLAMKIEEHDKGKNKN